MNKDDQLNFRINSELKQKFSELCEKHRYTFSEALSEYMFQCIQAGELINIATSSNATSSNVQQQIDSLHKELDNVKQRLDKLEGKAIALVK